MATARPSPGPLGEQELEEAIRELEEHLVRLRALLEEARAGAESDTTDWSVFDPEPRQGPKDGT